MRRSVQGIPALCLVASLAAACGGGGGSASCPNPPDIAGDWSGAVTNDTVARGASGSVRVSFATAACRVTGTSWLFSFPSDAALNQDLTVKGTVDGASVSLDLKNAGTGCDFRVTGTLASPTEISGSYQSTEDCSASETGSFDITLQARATPTVAATTPTVPAPTPTP